MSRYQLEQFQVGGAISGFSTPAPAGNGLKTPAWLSVFICSDFYQSKLEKKIES